MSQDLYSSTFHSKIQSEETPQAERIAEYIKQYIKPSCYLDFGCSTGIYLRAIKSKLPDISSYGFEFSNSAIEHAVTSDIIQADLSIPLSIEKKPDTLGLCLEVLEHIPDEYWRQVLENIATLSDKIIFSAAVPGQGGVGHINCRPKIDWIRRFHLLGWIVDYDATRHFLKYMQGGYHMGWLANNAVIFIKA